MNILSAIKFSCITIITIIIFTGCSVNQRLMPMKNYAGIIPNYASQQSLFAEATSIAVKNLSFPKLKSKKVYMEVVGCLPESALYDYVVDSVASKIAESGGIVLPVSYENLPVYSKNSKIEFVPTKSIIPDTDYRVVVALETSGVDKLTKGSSILWGLLGNPDVYYEGIIKIRVTAYPRKDGLPSIVKRGKGEVSRLVSGKSDALVHYKSEDISVK